MNGFNVQRRIFDRDGEILCGKPRLSDSDCVCGLITAQISPRPAIVSHWRSTRSNNDVMRLSRHSMVSAATAAVAAVVVAAAAAAGEQTTDTSVGLRQRDKND